MADSVRAHGDVANTARTSQRAETSKEALNSLEFRQYRPRDLANAALIVSSLGSIQALLETQCGRVGAE